MIKKLLQGMVVGIANIIPGVSGGTMMVAMGLYDKLIHAITHLKSEFKNSMKLLIPIFIGAGAAIVILSRLFEFLLENYPLPANFASFNSSNNLSASYLGRVTNKKFAFESVHSNPRSLSCSFTFSRVCTI